MTANSVKKVLLTQRFDIEEITQTLGDGTKHRREIVRHPGAVVVLPIVDQNHVCLIETYRLAIDRTLLELPAGTLEPPESPLNAAYRELAEETGYRAAQMTHLHSYNMSPGILDERMHLYAATELTLGSAAREQGELMENRVFSWSEIDRLLRDGAIEDAKTLVGLFWYMRYKIHA